MQDTNVNLNNDSNLIAKTLVPNKTWLLEEQGQKVGTLNKEKKGYSFFQKGKRTVLTDLPAVKKKFGSDIIKESINYSKSTDIDTKSIYDFPCNSKPFNPVYNIKKKLPIYAKSSKSKSLYCAGYYVIKFRKGWVKSLCPKLITLERYPYKGPFKSENDMKNVLNTLNKYETT